MQTKQIFFFLINVSKWFLNYQLETTQSSSHNQTNNQDCPQLKVDIVLNVQTNTCENKIIQVFKWKYKGKGKKAHNIMTTPQAISCKMVRYPKKKKKLKKNKIN